MSDADFRRRRRGIGNRLRRVAYAVLLWLSPHGQALASDHHETSPEASQGPAVGQAKLKIESVPSGVPGVAALYRVQFIKPDSRIAAPFRRVAEYLRAYSWTFNDRLMSLRGGVRLDLDLPDSGRLHLDLFADENDQERGQRWQLSTDGATPQGNLWSLGGRVNVVNPEHLTEAYRVKADRQVSLTPQLILDMDRLAGMPGNAQLTLQRTNWHDPVTRHDTQDRVWQVNVSWRF